MLVIAIKAAFRSCQTIRYILTTPLVLQGESYVRSQSFRPLEGGRRRPIHREDEK
jgi:hypothetical protein